MTNMGTNEKLLRALANKRKLNEYIDVIDWLLNDDRLRGLKNKQKFTTKIKKYAKKNDIVFRQITTDDVIEEKTICFQTEKYFYYSKGKSIYKSTITNIRNSIAHGNCYIEATRRELLFVAEDFNRNRELTAIIRVPLSMLKTLRELYFECLNENICSCKETNKNNKKELSKV